MGARTRHSWGWQPAQGRCRGSGEVACCRVECTNGWGLPNLPSKMGGWASVPKAGSPPAPPAVQPARLEAVGEQFLQELARDGRYAEAAALAPRVLKVGSTIRQPRFCLLTVCLHSWQSALFCAAQSRQAAHGCSSRCTVS